MACLVICQWPRLGCLSRRGEDPEGFPGAHHFENQNSMRCLGWPLHTAFVWRLGYRSEHRLSLQSCTTLVSDIGLFICGCLHVTSVIIPLTARPQYTLYKVQVNLSEKNTWIYLNRSGWLFPPELHLNLPEIYLKFTWKFQASMAEFLPELAWKSPEKYNWKVQVVFLVQVFFTWISPENLQLKILLS